MHLQQLQHQGMESLRIELKALLASQKQEQEKAMKAMQLLKIPIRVRDKYSRLLNKA